MLLARVLVALGFCDSPRRPEINRARESRYNYTRPANNNCGRARVSIL